MNQHVREFLAFQRNLLRYAFYIRGVLVGLLLMIVAGGVAISFFEKIPLGDAIYFAFITGSTIGYGDISPVTPWGRVVSVGIGMSGILFTGLYVAVATRALADTAKQIKSNE